MLDYTEKRDAYFATARREIAPLLPPGRLRVLEIGCGAGATLAWMKESGIASETVGIDISSVPADTARLYVDTMIEADAETTDLPASLGNFDAILCLDVLEHMVDPWGFIERIQERLTPDGVMISSIPNVRHLKVLIPLLFQSRWDYVNEGILDRTHLRFFTESSARDLMSTGTLRVQKVIRHIPPKGSKSYRFNLWTLGLLRSFMVMQFLISARRQPFKPIMVA